MSKFYLQHPEDDQLLAFADGELSGLAATRLKRHLKDCWRCRTQLEDLQSTVTGFMRYKETVLESQLPDPPMSWRNMKVEFERIDRTVPPPRFSDRMVARYGMPAVRVASVAAVLAVSGLAYIVLKPAASAPDASPQAASKLEAPVSATPSAPAIPAPQQPVRGKIDAAASQNDAPKANAEVLVAAALHRLKADLGEPIDFAADPQGRVSVTGTALSANRRDEIAKALRGIGGVNVQFQDARSASNGPARAAALVEGGRLPWQSELEQILGGKTQVENFGNTVLDLSDIVVARAHALRKLDERFAAAVLDPGDRAQVDAIASEHKNEMARASGELKRKLAPILAKLGTGISTASKWPMLTAAQQTDQWLNAIFAGAATDRGLEQAAAELGRALGSLE